MLLQYRSNKSAKLFKVRERFAFGIRDNNLQFVQTVREDSVTVWVEPLRGVHVPFYATGGERVETNKIDPFNLLARAFAGKWQFAKRFPLSLKI